MTRDEVLAVVKKYIADAVEHVDVSALDTSRSMKDYGINSLDMVEVVSRAMRELRIKLPRAELNKLQNIDGLIDLLHKATRERVS